MMIERCNLACLIAEIMMNTMVMVLWGYLKHLRHITQFSVEQGHLTRYKKESQGFTTTNSHHPLTLRHGVAWLKIVILCICYTQLARSSGR